jgi:hypothetical protein
MLKLRNALCLEGEKFSNHALSQDARVNVHSARSQIGTSLLYNIDANIGNGSSESCDLSNFFHCATQVNRTCG